MRLIIDGYNFIGRQGGLRGNIEAKRNRLISDLEQYRQTKPHDVTVVFDGTRSGDPFEHEERTGGVAIVYSRRGESADEVIVRMAAEWGRDSIVVTSDRAVGQSCTASGALVLFSGEFESRLRAALSNELSGTTEDDPPSPHRSTGDKSGNPYRRPKKERQRAARIRGL
jgi:predicted RNA-binding protein with PIN domain